MKNKKSLTYEQKLRRFLIPILRRKSLYWTGRNEAKQDARRARGFYECRNCHLLFGPKEIELDHINPIISIKESWINWDHYIKSLFCEKTNFAVLCKNCHSIKTNIENSLRKINKNARNKNKK